MDALNDQLTEERKRSRDLQWATEKERCRTGRDEERKREELEVRGFKQMNNRVFFSNLTNGGTDLFWNIHKN